MGKVKRQVWAQTHSPNRLGWHWTQHARVRLCAQFDHCADSSRAWWLTEWVCKHEHETLYVLADLFCRNIGVLQTTVAEVVTVESHQARAYSIMPFVWCLGSIIGSGLGGTLADPVRNYPGYFGAGTTFEKYPYLLPNLVCTGVVVFGMVVGILFLEETHEDKKDRKDLGLEAGKWLLSFVRPSPQDRKMSFGEESLTLLVDSPPGYSSVESSPSLNPVAVADLPLQLQDPPSPAPRPTRNTSEASPFTRQVILNIISYGILA